MDPYELTEDDRAAAVEQSERIANDIRALVQKGIDFNELWEIVAAKVEAAIVSELTLHGHPLAGRCT